MARELPTLGGLPRRSNCSPPANGGGWAPNPGGPELGAQLVAKRAAAVDRPAVRWAADLPRTCSSGISTQWCLLLPPGAVQLGERPGVRAAGVPARLGWPGECSSTSRRRPRSWAGLGRARPGRGGRRPGLDASGERRTRCTRRLAEVWAPFAGRSPAGRAPRPPRPTSPALGSSLAADTDADAPRAPSGWSASASRTAPGAPAARLTPRLGLWDLSATSRPTRRRRPVVSALGPSRRPRPRGALAGPAGRGAGRTDPRRAGRGARPAARIGRCAAGSSRSSAPAPALAEHLAAHPADWGVLGRTPRDHRAPARRQELQRRMLAASAPTRTTRRGACGWAGGTGRRAAAGRRPCGGPTARAVLLARRPRPGGGARPPTRSPPSWPTSPPPCSPPASRSPWPSCRPAAACRLAVIAMGKTGGRELNYVCDVDVVFVAEPVDPSDPERRAGQRDPGRRRADADLPAGGLGGRRRAAPGGQGRRAGARPWPGMQAYYERWASTWEFQALLKMRPAAGDPDLGRGYLDALWPMVWSAGDRPGFVDDVQAMRRRVEDNIPPAQADRELKLGPRRAAGRRVRGAAAAAGARPGRRVAAAGRHADGAAALSAAATSAATTPPRWSPPTGSCARSSTGCSCTGCAAPTCCPTRRPAAALAGPGAGLQARRPRRRGRGAQAELALHTREVRRLHEKLFYRPLLHAVARVPGEQLRLTPEAAAAGCGARASATGRRAAAPGGADRRGVPAGGDPATCCRCCCRASPPPRTRTPACSPTGRCPRRSARAVVPAAAARRGAGRAAAGLAARAPAGTSPSC